MRNLKFKSYIFKSSNKSCFHKSFYKFLFDIYIHFNNIKMSKNLSAKYYEGFLSIEKNIIE